MSIDVVPMSVAGFWHRFSYESLDIQGMSAFGTRLATAVRAGDCVTLSGDIGSGKTSLARAILQGLGFVGEVPSPTYTLVQTYGPPDVNLAVLHVDLYRVKQEEEVWGLGLEEDSAQALLLVEWPEKAYSYFASLEHVLRVHLSGAGESCRFLHADVPLSWKDRGMFT